MATRYVIVSIFYGLLLIDERVVATTTSAPTTSPGELIGTPYAPTTPGGDCLNENDYSERWTAVIKDELTGFDCYPTDLQLCTEACVTTMTSTPQSEAYECGGFSQPPCPEDLPAICVQDCFLGIDKPPLIFPEVNVQGYTESCAHCFGELSQCSMTNCALPCTSGVDQPACQSCNEDNCYADFMVCSGLNPRFKESEVENPDAETQAPSQAPSASKGTNPNIAKANVWFVMALLLVLQVHF